VTISRAHPYEKKRTFPLFQEYAINFLWNKNGLHESSHLVRNTDQKMRANMDL
jgi:hypothetical protein